MSANLEGPPPVTTTPLVPVRPWHTGRLALTLLGRYGTLLGMAVMILAFSAASPAYFPTFSNFLNILNQVSLTAIIAAGLTVTVIVGEMDLSIGFVGSFAGVLVTGLIAHNGLPVPLAVAVVVIGGALVGCVNGFIVSTLRVNSVIATLGSGSIVLGLNYAYSTGAPISSGMPPAFSELALGRLFGIPHNILFMALVLALLWLLVNRTEAGQWIQAVGGNAEAARLSGIRVERVKVLAFALAGACAALTGVLLASLIGSGTTGAADAYLLSAFAAVFLGSATLRDGEFHIVGTFIGVLIIGIGFNGLAIFGAPTFYQYVLQGTILIVAVALSSVARRLAAA